MTVEILSNLRMEQALSQLREAIVNEADALSQSRLFATFWRLLADRHFMPLRPDDRSAVELQVNDIGRLWRTWLSGFEDEIGERILRENAAAPLPGSPLSIEGYSGLDAEVGTLDRLELPALAFIGCGPYPETLASIASRCKSLVRVVGIDRSAEAVASARAVFPRLCSRGIEADFVQVDATCFDFAQVPGIFVANGTLGKAAVLTYIARTAPIGCVVMVRQPLGLAEHVYERIDVEAPFEEVGRVNVTCLSELVVCRIRPDVGSGRTTIEAL